MGHNQELMPGKLFFDQLPAHFVHLFFRELLALVRAPTLINSERLVFTSKVVHISDGFELLDRIVCFRHTLLSIRGIPGSLLSENVANQGGYVFDHFCPNHRHAKISLFGARPAVG
jgi:hypothetical protein